jgi:hypothetical protein
MALSRELQFISQLTELLTENDIKVLCENELEYLRDKLGIQPVFNHNGLPVGTNKNSSILKTQITKYRNAIRDNIVLTDNNSDSIIKNGEYVRIHKALRYFNLADYEKMNVAQQKINKTTSDKSDLISFEGQAYINKSLELLDSESYISRLTGLLALTGRRHSEIMQTANFKDTGLSCVYIPHNLSQIKKGRIEDTVYHLLFEGQVKTTFKGEVKTSDKFGLFIHKDVPYKIPLLCEKELILESIQWLRINKPNPISELVKGSKELGLKVRKEYSDILPIRDLKPHTLRSAYCSCIWALYEKSSETRITQDLFFNMITGHTFDSDAGANYQKLVLNNSILFKAWFDAKRLLRVNSDYL